MRTELFLSLRTFKKFSVFLSLVKGHFSFVLLVCIFVLFVCAYCVSVFLPFVQLTYLCSLIYLTLLLSTLSRYSLFCADETLNSSSYYYYYYSPLCGMFDSILNNLSYISVDVSHCLQVLFILYVVWFLWRLLQDCVEGTDPAQEIFICQTARIETLQTIECILRGTLMSVWRSFRGTNIKRMQGQAINRRCMWRRAWGSRTVVRYQCPWFGWDL